VSETNKPEGEVLLQFDPPPDIGIGGRNVAPQSVAITGITEPGYGGVIVWAKYRDEWHANAGERYAVSHLLKAAEAEIRRLTVDRPIVGTTADGVEVHVGDPVWRMSHRLGEPPERWFALPDGGAGTKTACSISLETFYSTAAAAEAAGRERDRILNERKERK
jgi:hypothetical protein